MPRDRQSTQVQQENSLDIDLVRSALEPDYTILEELGRGGMAVVYRAKERALDREVAIKVLPSFMVMDKAFVERFQHEARTAGKLEHPNIVPIYRVGRRNRVIYFVMKLLRGQSLATVLRQRPKLTVAEVQRILIEVAGALGYAARRGVVHRDIKPDNILLDDEGRCVVTDFGIAKSSGGPLTAAGTSMGTPRYMSPEHARGIPLDGRSDMYSLGVVAYQCLSGRTPFDADDPFAILYKHINDPLPEPELTTDEEREVYAVIEKMLAKNPEDRFQSTDALITALGGTPAANTTLISSRPHRISGLAPTELIFTPTLRTKLRDWSRDRRVWFGTGVVVVGVTSFALVPKLSTSPAAIPAPVVAGQTTSAGGAATASVGAGVPGAGSSAPVPAAPAGAGAGTTTGARAPIVAGSTTGTRTASSTTPRRDSAASTTTRLTKVGSGAPAAVRTSARDATSKCPRNQLLPEGVPFTVLVDSIAPQQEGSKLALRYDVCGLSQGAPVSTTFRLRKLNQRNPLSRQPDKVVPYAEVLTSARSRRQFSLDLAGLSTGRYAIDVTVIDQRSRTQGATRQFQIVRK